MHTSSFEPLAPAASASPPRTFCRIGHPTSTQAAAPVVLLLGWADAPLKYVQKYADIYPPEATVLVQLSRFADFLCSDRGLAALTSPIIHWLHTHHVRQAPQRLGPPASAPTPQPSDASAPAALPAVVVHLFSNGGALLLHALQISATRAGHRLQILGITIDSAPSEGHLIAGARLMSRVAARGALLQYLIFVAAVVCTLLHRLTLVLTGRPTLFSSIWQALTTPAHPCTRLVMYSKADTMVSSEAVDRFVVYARGKGVQVVAKRWQDSAHVRHYVDHPDEYRALVHEHIVAPACKQLLELQ